MVAHGDAQRKIFETMSTGEHADATVAAGSMAAELFELGLGAERVGCVIHYFGDEPMTWGWILHGGEASPVVLA